MKNSNMGIKILSFRNSLQKDELFCAKRALSFFFCILFFLQALNGFENAQKSPV